MDDNAKRLFLTVAVCLGIMLAWTTLFAPKPKPKAPLGTTDAPAAMRSAPAVAPASPSAVAPTAASALPGAVLPTGPLPETRVTRRVGDFYEAVFTSRGARLASLSLLHAQYVRVLANGQRVPVDMVDLPSDEHLPLAVRFADGGPVVLTGLEDYRLLMGDEPTRLTYAWDDPGGRVHIEKEFTLIDGRYAIDVEVRVTNLASQRLREKTTLTTAAWQDPAESGGGLFSGLPNLREAIDVLGGEVTRTPVKDLPEQFEDRAGVLSYGGWGDRYFLFAIRPREVPGAQIAHRAAGGGTFVTATTMPEVEVAPGETATHRFALYVGPKVLELLEAEGDQLSDSVDYWVVGFLSRPLLEIMKVFHGWFGSWALAIFLLTLVIKVLFFPLTQKSFKSMKDMQTLKPKIDALKEKHAADKERMNQELMGLYRSHKINPLAGCLPMLLQMPVWIGLYRMIWSSVELYQASFLWLPDLTDKDPYYALPIALGVLTFVQQKLTPTTMDSAQQKMMMWMMPIMFTAFMLFLPSGLVLYIMMNSVLTIIQQWLIRRKSE